MKKIGKIFLQGLVPILPVALTIYIVYWLGTTAESLFGRLLKLGLHERFYYPGMGLVTGFLLIIGIGILMHVWVIQRLFKWGEGLLEHIPLVKTLYGSVKDIMGFFASSGRQQFSQVAVVTLWDKQTRILGVVTRHDFRDLPPGIGDEKTVAVYIPMSYQIGGYTILVPRDSVKPVDMSMEDAMRFALTAGMTVEKQ